MARAKIISMINYKGGVGKTTSVFNIAAGLSFLNHHSVLVIDLDPQCSLSHICLKAYNRTKGLRHFNLMDLEEEETINHVFQTYLNEDLIDYKMPIELERLIKRGFYTGSRMKLTNFDFIPATMHDKSCGDRFHGLDDLEIEMVRKHGGDKSSMLKNITLLSKFFTDYQLQEQYDFIIFDCPPANNLVTQNALVCSDYYMIPTIMDDMSTQGIHHLMNVIDHTIIQEVTETFHTIIEKSPDHSYLSFLKHKNQQLLGIFETLRKGSVNEKIYREQLEDVIPNKLFDAIIKNYVDTSKDIGMGKSLFETAKKNPYGDLVFEMLDRLNIQRVNARSFRDQL